MPKTITSIRDLAFYGCKSLESIELSSSVTSIGDRAFGECGNLDLVIDNSRSNVKCDSYTFYEVKSVTFTGSPLLFRVLENGEGVELTSDGENDPIYEKMDSVTIPSEAEVNGKKYPVTSIGNMTFRNCFELKSVTIPSSVTSIGNSAFHGCSSLTSIEIPSSMTSIGNSAFANCGSLTSIEIPSSVDSIGYGAFEYCRSLTSIEIPSSVTSIGEYAFAGCENLDVVIDNSRSNVNIEYKAFNGVKSVKYTGSTLLFDIEDGKARLVSDSALYAGFESISIPSEAEIKGKKYPVTSIGYRAFEYCSSLTSIEIPSSVTSIGSSAFEYCSSLTSIEIPSSVTSIGRSAFWGCENLDVVIDNSRSNVDIEYDAFYSVKSVTFTGSPLLFRVEDGAAMFVSDSTLYAGFESISIPSEAEIKGEKYPVTSIGRLAFTGCDRLTNIEIPSSVASIGDQAFWYCRSLTSIEIPSSVTSIGNQAFYGCRSLTSIEIPSSVTSIGYGAFFGCENLDVVIDNSRSNVEFSYSTFNGVKSVAFTGSPLLFSVLEDGKSVEVVNTYGDGDDIYPLLKSIKIPSEVEIKGKKYSVISIGDEAFIFCRSLTSIEIPSSVTSIGDMAFYGCENLDVVIDNSEGNVEIMGGALDDCKSVKYLK